jgi:adenosine deaminase
MNGCRAASERSVAALPKAHLHLHLEGSFPHDAVEALARKRHRQFLPPKCYRHVDEFFSAYLEVVELVETLDELADLCRAVVASEARHGVVYAEPAVEPQLYSRLGSMEEVLGVMLEAFADAQASTGVEIGALVTVNTDAGPDGAEEAARMAARYAGSGVVAFGTAGFVEPAGLARFVRPVAVARAAGLRIVCHAGQTGGPESVRDALNTLHPDRIAHGVQAAQDPTLLWQLADEGVVCDVCPTSNVALGVVADLAQHPLPVMLLAGVAVTLNADDELFFGADVSEQYHLARSTFAVPDVLLAEIARNGALRKATGMSDATRVRLKTGVEQWLNGDWLQAAVNRL